MLEVDISSFEGLIPRPLEPIGVFLPLLPQYGTTYNVDPIVESYGFMEVFDMVWLVNEAFQCLGAFNIDLRKAYHHIFNLLCL